MTTHPLHETALKLSKTYLNCERHLIAVLTEIDEKKVWRLLGYPSFFEYVLKALGHSESQTYTLTSVSRKCNAIPELKAAVLSEEVSLSNAKRILPVLTKQNQNEWIEKAQTFTTRKLEKEVAAMNPRVLVKEQVRPISFGLSKMTFCINEDTEKVFRKAQDLLSKKKRQNLNLEDTVKAMAEFIIEKLDGVEKARRAEKKQSAELIPAPVREKITSPPNQRLVPQQIKHQVYRRDKGECQATLPDKSKCCARRFVELHHIIPLSQGGFHHVGNLTTLCSAHHKHAHIYFKSQTAS